MTEKRLLAGLLASGLLLGLLPGAALAASTVAPNIIGFEGDPPGSGGEPWPSEDNPTVRFIKGGGSSVEIGDYGSASNGQGLRAIGTEGFIIIVFDVPTRRLSLRFGNDTPDVTQPGDRATLTVFRNDRRVARKRVTLNRNGNGDQLIEYRGRIAIDRASFVYERDGNLIEGAEEVVDDIVLAQVCTIRGDRGRDRLDGNATSNSICGKGGPDRISGHGANDILVGGGGPDRIIDGYGADLVVGGPGDDVLGAGDRTNDGDTFYPGPGNDTCIIDDDDVVRGTCEIVVVAPAVVRS
jgi:Ca2+-binding RTX toxin-like protein